MNSSDSAEELIKIYLDGVGFILRIVGEETKNLVAFLFAMSKDKQQTKGKARLSNMLKTGKELKIFTIKAEDLKVFSQEAKKYGVLYCVLANKKNEKIDGMVDIMVRQEDASKVNRIAERFNFTKVDTTTIAQKLEKEKQDNEIETKEKSIDEQMIDELLSEPKEVIEQENIEEDSPSNERTEEENLLESSLNIKSKLEESEIERNNGKKSVKKELKQIQQELIEKQEVEIMPEKEIAHAKEKTKPKHLKHEKEEYKGKHFKEPKHMDNQNGRKKSRKRNRIRERSK